MQFKNVLFVLNLLLLSVLVAASRKIRIKEAEKRNSYHVYWNTPTNQCVQHKIDFSILTKKYNIKQNEYNKFQGDVITILYDPGAFPAILTSPNRSEVYRNGGVPQEGDLILHLNLFRDQINELIPNINFPGIGIIDFESWRPVFRQNFGTLTPYKELSYEIEKQLHPSWPNSLIEKEAQRRFELHGKIFMEETLIYAKKLRPNATWGYYGYPHCFNHILSFQCPNEIKKENNGIPWLFLESDNLYPSLYLQELNFKPKDRQELITGRIQEPQRIIKEINKSQDTPIIPYFWYKYQDTKNFLTKEDIYNSLHNLKKLSVDGLVIWGSSNDVNSKRACEELYEYVDNILGPAINSTL